jgi:hypothetical protein
MPLVELFATEADYQLGKSEYDDLIDSMDSKSSKEEVRKAAQLNVDLQTSLLQMSNQLPPGTTEQFKLMAAADYLDADYAQLLSDSSTVAVMYKSQAIMWFLIAATLVGIYVSRRTAN